MSERLGVRGHDRAFELGDMSPSLPRRARARRVGKRRRVAAVQRVGRDIARPARTPLRADLRNGDWNKLCYSQKHWNGGNSNHRRASRCRKSERSDILAT